MGPRKSGDATGVPPTPQGAGKKSRARPAKQPILPDLQRFVCEEFAFLAAAFKLELASDLSAPDSRENSVRLRNEHVVVSLVFESMPPMLNVGVSQLAPGTEGRIVRTCPLVYLLAHRCPEKRAWLGNAGERASYGHEELRAVLRELAQLLAGCIGDLLAGKADIPEAIMAEVAADRRRQLKLCFGTSTGESPRFQGRPSLPELFSDVSEETLYLRVPRTVQAVYDYSYSVRDVAEFLGLSELVVRAFIAQWNQTE